MLVLSRSLDEKVVIIVPPSDKPTMVRVTLTDVRSSRDSIKAKIGFEAPEEVVIHRSEILEAIARGGMEGQRRDTALEFLNSLPGEVEDEDAE